MRHIRCKLSSHLLLLLFCILGGVPSAACVLLLILCSWGIFAFALQSSFRAKCGWCNVSFMRKLLKRIDTSLPIEDNGQMDAILLSDDQ